MATRETAELRKKFTRNPEKEGLAKKERVEQKMAGHPFRLYPSLTQVLLIWYQISTFSSFPT